MVVPDIGIGAQDVVKPSRVRPRSIRTVRLAVEQVDHSGKGPDTHQHRAGGIHPSQPCSVQGGMKIVTVPSCIHTYFRVHVCTCPPSCAQAPAVQYGSATRGSARTCSGSPARRIWLCHWSVWAHTYSTGVPDAHPLTFHIGIAWSMMWALARCMYSPLAYHYVFI